VTLSAIIWSKIVTQPKFHRFVHQFTAANNPCHFPADFQKKIFFENFCIFDKGLHHPFLQKMVKILHLKA